MKKITTLIITLYSLTTFGQKYSDVVQEKMTLEKWSEEAKTNIRLFPKYGYFQKTEAQKKSDQEFIEASLKKDSTHRKASERMIKIGFNYLYNSDIKTAMYRFNQAYLLDSTNLDIYWGFGAVYMTLGDYEHAEKQYVEGLSIDANNIHLLTDYGTYFMNQYYLLQPIDEKNALLNLESAIIQLEKSYTNEPNEENTTFKLSICYWNKGNCENAWKYYDICKTLGGRPITEDYEKDLKKKCKRRK
jgi:tetratricopeptide (TPR) repeat protein